MIRFIKHNFDSIDGIALYPTIALFISLTIFIAAIAYIFILKKEYFSENAQLPLDDDNNL